MLKQSTLLNMHDSKAVNHVAAVPQKARIFTCSGMTIMKILFSFVDKTCLTKKKPVPIKTIHVNIRAPFSLEYIFKMQATVFLE